jgi:prepilin peptidase CpaA
MADTTAETIYLTAAVICAVGGACSDYRSRRIPNWLTASSTLFALILHALLGGWRSMGTAMLAGLAAGMAFLLFYLAGGMGGGDVKLMTAVAVCAGLSHVAAILIATALIGGIFALVLALAAGRLRQTVSNVVKLLSHHGTAGLRPHPDLNLGNTRALRLPYGIAIGAGTAITLFSVLLGR